VFIKERIALAFSKQTFPELRLKGWLLRKVRGTKEQGV
jgi:hypothetical protein